MSALSSRRLYAVILAIGVINPVLMMPRASHSATVNAEQHLPELPRNFVDTRYIRPTGNMIKVLAGGDLQAALNEAQPGDVITVQAGAVFTGNFVLPDKQGSGWISVESSATDTKLPSPGTRVSPIDADAMPKLEATSGAVLTAAPGANHYRLIGIEIRPGISPPSVVHKTLSWLRSGFQSGDNSGSKAPLPTAAFLDNLVSMGNRSSSIEALPDHIIFDRCYIHGDPVVGARRGIALNARYAAVIDSYLSNFKEIGADSQAIAVWNGSGPFKIENNYLEAAGENIMFGGKDPAISGLVPSDIVISGNHLAKPLAWKAGNPGYRQTHWSIKNLFELKNAQRVLIEGNVFEYNWAQSQNGFSILFTVRNQNGGSPWSVVQDVTFTDNVIQHVANGINILARDDNYQSQQTRRILIGNNLFDDIGGIYGSGTLLLLNGDTADVKVIHNTALQSGNILFADGRADSGFVFINNIVSNNQYGMTGTDTGVGEATLKRYFPDAEIRSNVIIGGPASLYPDGNNFPRNITGVGFSKPAAHDYRLLPSSLYQHKATDGNAIGVDINRLCSILSSFGKSMIDLVPSCMTQKMIEKPSHKHE